MDAFFGPFLLFLFLSQVVTSQTVGKVCVTRGKFEDCLILQSTSTFPVQCVSAEDRLECVHKINDKRADFLSLPSNEAYAASTKFSDLVPILEEKSSENTFMYESVAVVKKDFQIKSLVDLKGKKSCHTGYKRTAGWNIPIALLVALDALPCDRDELAAVSSFFSESCVPGNWSKNVEQNAQLKKKYSNSCQLCSSGCSVSTATSDRYLGYEGALKCLVEKSADIAFTKYSVVLNFSSQTANFTNDYRLLCPNGSVNPLIRLCQWGGRPNSLIIGRQESSVSDRQRIQEALLNYLDEKPWPQQIQGILVQNKYSAEFKNISGSIKDHLAKGNFTITMDKPSGCLKKYAYLCVKTELEKRKCEDLKIAAFANRLRPRIECVVANDCNERIENGQAEFVVADIKNTYEALTHYNLMALMAEKFKNEKPNYYLVAVIKSTSNIKTLQDLRGTKSCHSHFSSASSWSIPKGSLTAKKLLQGPARQLDKQMSEFFSSSCVPGAPSQFPKLCSLCKGDHQNQSKCSDEDEFADFSGAFRCLAVGGGDVAFVPHYIVNRYTDDETNAESWAKPLKSNNFKLLCLSDEVKNVTNYESCNWGRIPGNHLLVSSAMSEENRLSLLLMMIQADSSFSSTSATFKMYSSYENKTNVIFSNGTETLVPLALKKSANDLLGDDIVNTLKLIDTSDAFKLLQINFFLILITVCLIGLHFNFNF